MEEVGRDAPAERGGGVLVVGEAGHHLVQDDVAAAHVLPRHRAEVVPGAVAEAAVRVHVLDDVPDVFDAVRAAPVTDLQREVLAVELRGGVHVGEADARRIGALVPELAEARGGVLAELLGHPRGELVRIRQREALLADGIRVESAVVEMLADQPIVELRLVGEEAGDHGPEEVAVVRVVRLVDRLEQHGAGFARERVDAAAEDAAPRPPEPEDAPATGRDVPVQKPVADASGEVNRRAAEALAAAGRAAVGSDAEEDVALRRPGRDHGGPGRGAHRVDVALDERALREVGIPAFDEAVREACREALVVEDPDLHPAARALGEDDVHVAPPAVAAEVGMRARLDAERAAAGIADAGDLRRDAVAVVAALPVEREEVVVLASVQDVG